MKRCKCGSYAINEHLYDRKPGVHSDLCDVCYWRAIADERLVELERLRNELNPMTIHLRRSL